MSGTLTASQAAPVTALTTVATTGVEITRGMSGHTIYLTCSAANGLAYLPAATVGLNYKIVLATDAPAISSNTSIKAGPLVGSDYQGFWGSVFVGTEDGIDANQGNPNERVASIQNQAQPSYDGSSDTTQDFLNFCDDGTNCGGQAGNIIYINCYEIGMGHVEAHLTTEGVLTVGGTVDAIDGDGSPS